MAFWAVSLLVPAAIQRGKILFWLGILTCLLVIYILPQRAGAQIFSSLRRRACTRPGGAAPRGSFLDIFSPPLLRTPFSATTLSTGMLAAYYSITTWCRHF